nr:hypothetical protein Iba_chr06dCG10440 [Ipomoea batatas]
MVATSSMLFTSGELGLYCGRYMGWEWDFWVLIWTVCSQNGFLMSEGRHRDIELEMSVKSIEGDHSHKERQRQELWMEEENKHAWIREGYLQELPAGCGRFSSILSKIVEYPIHGLEIDSEDSREVNLLKMLHKADCTDNRSTWCEMEKSLDKMAKNTSDGTEKCNWKLGADVGVKLLESDGGTANLE